MGKEAMQDSKNAIIVSVITILSKNQTQKSKKFEKQSKKEEKSHQSNTVPVCTVGHSLDPVCPRPVPSLRQPLDLGLVLPRPLDLDLYQGSL